MAAGLRAIAALFLVLLWPAHTAAASTTAGMYIINTAGLTFDLDDSSASTSSNTSSTLVHEVLDLKLSRATNEVAIVPPDRLAAFAIPFVLVNTGNGPEAFYVEATTQDQDSALTVAIDVDESGTYDSAVDIALPKTEGTPILAPEASLTLLLRFERTPATAGTARIVAKALTGSGDPGTTFVGKGEAGSDALIGLTRAEGKLSLPYQPGEGRPAAARLEKSQVVRAPDGSATPVKGAVVTYRLALTTSAGAVMRDAEIIDSIPAGTTFVPGSIQIEDAAASDVSDADPAHFDGEAIHIALGEISQPTTRVVTFQVTIR